MKKAAVKRLTADDVEALLRNWRRLNDALLDLPLPEVLKLLEVEVEGRRRPSVVMRLFGRFNHLRSTQERDQLLSGNIPWRGAA